MEYETPDALAYRNVEAEGCVLGAAMQDEKALQRLKELSIDLFTEPAHRMIYTAMMETGLKGMTVDLVTMNAALSEQNKLELIGGTKYLMGIMQRVVATANVGSYIQIIQDCAARRQMKEIGEALIRKSGSMREEIDVVREDAAMKIRDVRASSGVPLVNQKDAVMMTYEKLGEAQSREGKEKDLVMTGIRPLDRMTGGLYGSKLMIIGARPSVGKSIFAMTICMNAAKQGKRVLYITREMEVEELMEREMAAASLVSLSEITSGEITEKGWAGLASTLPELSGKKITYSTQAWTVSDVRKAAFWMYEHEGIDLVCVDYIQLMDGSPNRKWSNRQEEVADISRNLKRLAQELQIPVIALSQLNRGSAKEKRPPTMNDARESGAIEQDANIFLLLHDPEVDELKTEEMRRMAKNLNDNGMKLISVNVDKNRQGKKGMFHLAFDGAHMRFLPLTKEEQP